MASENTVPATPITVAESSKSERTELVDGRVWRRVGSATQQDKSNGGPVLRTTVKPVKRFRPDSKNDKTNPSPNRKKKLKTFSSFPSKSDDSAASGITATGSSEGKKILHAESLATLSPDGKRTPTTDAEKVEKSQQEPHVAGDCSLPTRKKRVWEQWSVEDKDYFFEAVAMYGKDFEAIRSAIAQKHRRKGQDSMAKTKDQVRHFYYRTWAMINKMINDDAYPLEINKAFQELYALINYGELRRKLGGNLKKKGIDKLNELIKHGNTSARVKGKNFRIKTPSCRALKKLNPEYQGKEGTLDLPLVSDTRRMKIPLNVAIDLYPLTMADWNKVHLLAHNPRLRVRLPVESQLSSLFTYLDRKWKRASERLMYYANKNMWCSDQANQSMPDEKEHGKLVIQTPADASVNTRIMVFQVSSNKSHAVVSYALKKSTRAVEKSSKETTNKSLDDMKQSGTQTFDTINGSVSETEAIDSCLSSEDDFDYDSANDEVSRVLKDADPDDDRATPTRHAHISSVDDGCVETLDTMFTVKSREHNAGYDSDVICNQTSADDLPEDSHQSPEGGTKEQISVQSDTNNSTEGLPEENQSLTAAPDVAPNNENDSVTTDKLLAPENVYDKCQRKKKYRTVKNTDFIKSIQMWNIESCGNTTIAEIFMMLGKPSVFKLCYHWLRNASDWSNNSTMQTNSEEESPKKIPPVPCLSSGLLALLQAADLSRQHIDNNASAPVEPEHRSVPCKNKTLGVQCDLIKTPLPAETDGCAKSTECAGNERQQRGLRKTGGHNSATGSNVESVADFAVPSTPVNQRKKNTDNAARGTTVSPETMNWLLQKERSRCRQMRRPIVFDRQFQNRPIRSNARMMKTFSIVMQDRKKVKFLPSQVVTGPVNESTTENAPEFLEAPSQDKDSNISVGYYLEGEYQGSLLAQAAHEAGVLPSEKDLSTTNSDSHFTNEAQSVEERNLNECNLPCGESIDNGTAQQMDGNTLVSSAAEMVSSESTRVMMDSSTVESMLAQLSWNHTEGDSFSLVQELEIGNSLPLEVRLMPENNTSSTRAHSASGEDSQTGEELPADKNNGGSIGDNGDVSNPLDKPEFDREGLLATPQKILPGDFEDSFDGILLKTPAIDKPSNSSLNLDGIRFTSGHKYTAQVV